MGWWWWWYGGVGSHQGELVDLHVERLQLALADHLLRVLGEELERLQVNAQPVHLHVPAGVQPEVRLGHPWVAAAQRCAGSEPFWLFFFFCSHDTKTTSEIRQTCKFIEVVADVEGLVVVAGVLVVDEADVT